MPTAQRRLELWSSYKFLCNCSKCQDVDRDYRVIGLRCPNRGCNGYGCYQQHLSLDTNRTINDTLLLHQLQQQQDMQQRWVCSDCGETENFHSVIAERDDVMDTIQGIPASFSDSPASTTFEKAKTALLKRKEFQRQFQRILNLCTLTSWYTLQVGEELSTCTVKLLTLFDAAKVEEQESTGQQELQIKRCPDLENITLLVLQKLSTAAENCYASSQPDDDNLRLWYFKIVKAKTTQYISPCSEALQTLKDAYEVFKFYYSPEQEIMRGIVQYLN